MTDFAALYADHPTMTNHWWWRPGWHVGTRFYAWHLTQSDHPEVVGLTERYQRALSGITTLDPIPARWLHMTLQGVGHVEDVNAAMVEKVVDAVASRARDLQPITTTYQRAHILGEALALPPSSPEALVQLRQTIRAGIADVFGTCPESVEGFRPHVSLAYSSANADTEPIREALDLAQPAQAAAATYTHVAFILMHRDRRLYEWEPVTQVPIGQAG